jgi:hypothetical protein
MHSCYNLYPSFQSSKEYTLCFLDMEPFRYFKLAYAVISQMDPLQCSLIAAWDFTCGSLCSKHSISITSFCFENNVIRFSLFMSVFQNSKSRARKENVPWRKGGHHEHRAVDTAGLGTRAHVLHP